MVVRHSVPQRARAVRGRRTSYRHWFDGQAMLHRFAIDGGAVLSPTPTAMSTRRASAAKAGRIAFAEFATDPASDVRQAVHRFRPNRQVVNPNVNIAPLGGRMVALTETPLPVAFDPETLQTVGSSATRTTWTAS